MMRKASVLLGMAVLLSLLFPVKALLKELGVDPLAWRWQSVDVAALCVLIALLPAFAFFHDARLAHRIPRWSGWVALLAACSLLFLLLHVNWSLDLATAYAREALGAGTSLPLAISHVTLLDGLEVATRLGVLVSLVGVLVRLDAAPEEDAPVPRRKKQ